MPDISGHLTDFGHELPVRVYFEDTDFTGIVYHARYVQFFERGRSDFLRLKGVNHVELEKGRFGDPLFFIVKNLTLDFHGPSRIDDLLMIKTTIEGTKGARLVMVQSAFCEENLIASSRVTLVLVDGQGKPKRMPKELLHIFLN